MSVFIYPRQDETNMNVECIYDLKKSPEPSC